MECQGAFFVFTEKISRLKYSGIIEGLTFKLVLLPCGFFNPAINHLKTDSKCDLSVHLFTCKLDVCTIQFFYQCLEMLILILFGNLLIPKQEALYSNIVNGYQFHILQNVTYIQYNVFINLCEKILCNKNIYELSQ